MNPIQVLMAAQAAGIEVATDGGDLLLMARTRPPDAVVVLLEQHKRALLSLLQSAEKAALLEEPRAAFEERAGIAEHDGGLPRAHAEVLAAICVAPAKVAGDRDVVIDAAARFLEQILKG